MKINEILREDVNTDTGTPNPDPQPSTWDRLKNKASDIGQGIKQGASQFGQRAIQGAQQVANVASRVPGAIEKGVQGYNQSYDDATAAGRDNRYGIEKGIAGAKGAVQGYKQNYDAATAAGRDNRFAIQKYPQAMQSAIKSYQDSYNSRSPEENELLINKLIKKFGPGIKGAINGYKQSYDAATAAGRDNRFGIQKLAQKVVPAIRNQYNIYQGNKVAGPALKAAGDNWLKYVKQLSSFKDMSNDATYQAELEKWARSLYPSAFADGQEPAKVTDVHPDNLMGGVSVSNYIMKTINASAAARALRKGTGDRLPKGSDDTETPAGAGGTQTTPAGIVVPQTVGGGARKQSQQATTAPANTQSTAPGPDAHDDTDVKHDLAPGVEIVQHDPIIVKYKNKEYGINDAGQWVHFGTSRIPHESFQAFLDRQAGY